MEIYFIMILIFIVIFLSYYLGKSNKEQEIQNNNNKLKQQYNKNKIKDINKVKEYLKKGNFILLITLFLFSCTKTINTNCPNIVNYSIEEQEELTNILDNNNNITLNKFIIDYFNLRQDIRICNGL